MLINQSIRRRKQYSLVMYRQENRDTANRLVSNYRRHGNQAERLCMDQCDAAEYLPYPFQREPCSEIILITSSDSAIIMNVSGGTAFEAKIGELLYRE